MLDIVISVLDTEKSNLWVQCHTLYLHVAVVDFFFFNRFYWMCEDAVLCAWLILNLWNVKNDCYFSWCCCLSWRVSCAFLFCMSWNEWVRNKTKQTVDGLCVCTCMCACVRENFVKVDYNYKHNKIQKTVWIILFIINRNRRNQRKN